MDMVISLSFFFSPKKTPIDSLSILYLTSLSIFCSIRIILGTKNNILKPLRFMFLSFLKKRHLLIAALLAHSNAISVFPVPVEYMMDPLYPFFIQAVIAFSWSFVKLNGNFRFRIAGDIKSQTVFLIIFFIKTVPFDLILGKRNFTEDYLFISPCLCYAFWIETYNAKLFLKRGWI